VVLERLIRDAQARTDKPDHARLTADEYINLQWLGTPPEEFEPEYQEIIDLLKAYQEALAEEAAAVEA
jgi:hypothetical protein